LKLAYPVSLKRKNIVPVRVEASLDAALTWEAAMGWRFAQGLGVLLVTFVEVVYAGERKICSERCALVCGK
jgi:hypothetical protein